jgi:hypothetical protein
MNFEGNSMFVTGRLALRQNIIVYKGRTYFETLDNSFGISNNNNNNNRITRRQKSSRPSTSKSFPSIIVILLFNAT